VLLVQLRRLIRNIIFTPVHSYRQASTLISSLEAVLSGGDALMNEKSTSDEAMKRIQKAQALIGKFIAECGVQDDKLAAYVAAHK
jgi:hypothetical protein